MFFASRVPQTTLKVSHKSTFKQLLCLNPIPSMKKFQYDFAIHASRSAKIAFYRLRSLLFAESTF